MTMQDTNTDTITTKLVARSFRRIGLVGTCPVPLSRTPRYRRRSIDQSYRYPMGIAPTDCLASLGSVSSFVLAIWLVLASVRPEATEESMELKLSSEPLVLILILPMV